MRSSRHVLPEEGQRRPLWLDAVKDLGEAEGVVALEVALGQAHGDVLKGVEAPEGAAEGGPAHPLVVVVVDALRLQALRLPEDGLRHLPRASRLSPPA